MISDQERAERMAYIRGMMTHPVYPDFAQYGMHALVAEELKHQNPSDQFVLSFEARMALLHVVDGACTAESEAFWFGPPRSADATETREEVVYVMRRASDGALKIGRSVDPGSRRSALQTAAGCGIALVASFPGDRVTERELHTRFAAHRIHGEWFAPAPPVLAWLQTVSVPE